MADRERVRGTPPDLCAVSCCPTCGDFLFNGRHQGNVERWCCALSETETGCETKTLETKTPCCAETETPVEACETKTGGETKTPGETKTREMKTRNKGGRPRRQTIPPWEAAGMSRATWYRQRQQRN